jgi:hypothetical protein
MSLKNLKNVDIKSFSKNIGKPFAVQEKFNTPDFWIRISENGMYMMKQRKPVTYMDLFLNRDYHDVELLLNSKLGKDGCKRICSLIEEDYGLQGGCDIRIFYIPVAKPIHIDYSLVYDNGYNMFLGDIWTKAPLSGISDKIELMENIANILNIPTVTIREFDCTEGFCKTLQDYLKGYISSSDMFAELIGSDMTVSGLDFESCGGLILKNNISMWQFTCMDFDRIPYNEMHGKYRDIVLHDFVQEILMDDNFIQKAREFYDKYFTESKDMEKSYINLISFAFLIYINKTQIFTKYSIDAEDLMPVYYGYAGKAYIDLVNIPTVTMACKYNPLMSALLRMLANTFYYINFHTFSIFNEFETRAISKFVSIYYR